MLRRILLVLIIVIIIIQFIRPTPNKADGKQPNYIGSVYPVPEDVKAILDKACMDCHSNNTRYPWYDRIQPVAWWLNYHIIEGKKKLNFDEFLSSTPKKQDDNMKEVVKQVKENEMPLKSYTWIHKDAILSPEEKTKIMDWGTAIRKKVDSVTGFIPKNEK
jgi:Haem-binding domain